jgi:hypothetical protein
MVRYAATSEYVPVWVEVSSAEPCSICGGTSACGVHEDGEFGRCVKVVSDWPFVTGGWLHRLEARTLVAGGRLDHLLTESLRSTVGRPGPLPGSTLVLEAATMRPGAERALIRSAAWTS